MEQTRTIGQESFTDSLKSYSARLNKTLLVAFDALAFMLAYAAAVSLVKTDAAFVAFYSSANESSVFSVLFSWQSMNYFSTALVAMFILWGSKRHYTYRKPFWDELRDILSVLAVMALISLSLSTILKHGLSVSLWAAEWGLALFLLPVCRNLAKTLLNKLNVWEMPCVIIGGAQNASDAYLAIKSESSMGYNVCALVEPTGKLKHTHANGVSYISKDEFFKRSKSIHKVFLALEKNQTDLRDQWIRELTREGIRNISFIPDLRGVPVEGTDISHFFSHEVMMMRLKNNLARRSSRMIKRMFDLVCSSILLIFLSPFFAFIAFKVSRDGGSVTYGHERVGLNGKKFKCLKFRSMVMNSKEVLEELLATDPEAKAEWDKEFKLKNDPRITPVGNFLRKTSLDELPQLWNVFRGEMSLVGPRPVITEELERYHDDVAYYLMAKPGMSGLWQVSGRSDTDYDTRVYLDSWYVKNWSVWCDIVILFKTVGVVVKRDGAY